MPGQVTQPGSNPSEAPAALDMNTLVPVTVDGIQQMVPLQEALNGYAARQKMDQALQRAAAAEADQTKLRDFMTKLNGDPAGTIAQLQTSYGISTGTPSGDNPDEDPASAEVAQLKQALAAQNREFDALRAQVATQTQSQKLQQTIGTLKATHGDAFKQDDVLAYAVAKGIDDIDLAFKAWKFDNPGTQTPESNLEQNVSQLNAIAPGQPTLTPALPDVTLEAASDPLEAIRRGFASAGQDMDAQVAAQLG